MKAAVYHGPRDISVEEVPTPELEQGEILIRVRACGICGSDLHAYHHGMFVDTLSVPMGTGRVMGHEFGGEVIDIQGKISGIEIGDRVLAATTGANAEYVRIPANKIPYVFPLPKQLSFEETATIEPLATSLHATNLADPKADETHVIIGAGIIGLGILQVLKTLDSVKVIVVDLSDKRLEMALKLGADGIVNAGREDVLKKDSALTVTEEESTSLYTSGAVDTVYDCVGMPKNYAGQPILDQAMSLVKKNGKIVMVGIFEKNPTIDCNIILRKGISLFGSWAWARDELRHSLELLESGKIDRKPLITHRFPLDQSKEAYETQLSSDTSVKVLILP